MIFHSFFQFFEHLEEIQSKVMMLDEDRTKKRRQKILQKVESETSPEKVCFCF